MKKILFLVVVIVIVFLLLEDDKAYTEKTVVFSDGKTKLVGTLTIPKNGKKKHPCIVFVHGARDMPRDDFGYLKPYWQEFAKKGYAFLSWDKPGVGESSGDWHNQTMQDRAKEVVSAIKFLKKYNKIDNSNIGALGISQAGWVLPIVANLSKDVKFIISVSGAINWIEQDKFFEKNFLESKGYSPKKIASYLNFEDEVTNLVQQKASYDKYLKFFEKNNPNKNKNPMSLLDWNFYTLNINTDIKDILPKVDIPTLAIFGGKDVYVDVNQSMKFYDEVISKYDKKIFTIKYFENANHSMIETTKGDFVHTGFKIYWDILKMEFLGKDVFVKGYFETIFKWLEKQDLKQ